MVSLPHFWESVYVLKDEYQQGLDKVQTYGKVSREIAIFMMEIQIW